MSPLPARVSATAARRQFYKLVRQVASSSQRVIIHRHDKNVCAIVPVPELRVIELLEDHLDSAVAREVLAECIDHIPWSDAKRIIEGIFDSASRRPD